MSDNLAMRRREGWWSSRRVLIGNLGTIAGDDTIFGDTGNDVIIGGPGNDLLLGGSGRDRITGGTGQDTLPTGLDPRTFDLIRPASARDRPAPTTGSPTGGENDVRAIRSSNARAPAA